jgi:hypothetical protein
MHAARAKTAAIGTLTAPHQYSAHHGANAAALFHRQVHLIMELCSGGDLVERIMQWQAGATAQMLCVSRRCRSAATGAPDHGAVQWWGPGEAHHGTAPMLCTPCAEWHAANAAVLSVLCQVHLIMELCSGGDLVERSIARYQCCAHHVQSGMLLMLLLFLFCDQVHLNHGAVQWGRPGGMHHGQGQLFFDTLTAPMLCTSS